MGYEIVYQRQFIKTTRGYIPMVLMGSSNCTEVMYNGRERLERDWQPITQNNIDIPKENLIKYFETWTGGKYQQHFKYQNKWVDDKGLMRFVKNGIEKAITAEELQEKAHTSLWCYVSVWSKDNGSKMELEEYINTTDNLEKWCDKAIQRYNNKQENETNIFILVGLMSKNTLSIQSTKNITGKVLVKKRNSYIKSYSNWGIETTRDKTKAFVFENIEHAKEQLKDWIYKTRFVKADFTPPKEKHFAISYNSNKYGQGFVKKITRGGLHWSWHIEDAKKFETEQQAKKFIDERLFNKYENVIEFKVAKLTA